MKRSLEIKPYDAHSRHRISWDYASKGQIDRALDEMRIAPKLDPQSSYLNIYFAEMIFLARKPEEALASANKALDLEPASITAGWNKVGAYQQLDQPDKAESELKWLIEKTNRDIPVLLLAGRIYANSHKKKLAQDLLGEVARKNGGERYGSRMAFAESALGKKTDAVKRMKRVTEQTGGNFYTINYEPKRDPIRDD